MNRLGHETFAPVFGLAVGAGANYVAWKGYGVTDIALLPASPLVMLLGYYPAVWFSAGKNSPDIDHMWAPGKPRQNYHWAYHRGFTHRFWFASLLAGLTYVLASFMINWNGDLRYIIGLIFSPVVGWISHLYADMIFGKIKVVGKLIGTGWREDRDNPANARGPEQMTMVNIFRFMAIPLVICNCYLWFVINGAA